GPHDQLQNLGVAGKGGALSDVGLCALADETQQNGADRNGDGDHGDTVLVTGDIAALLAPPGAKALTNTRIATPQTLAASSLCVVPARSAGNGLQFYDGR